MDMKIDLVEEAFALLAKYELQLSKEDSEKVESLSYNWLQLQGKAMDVQLLLLTVQEHFQKELVANLQIFEKDCTSFVGDYHTNGPMQPGLTPREASDRLQMFQVMIIPPQMCSSFLIDLATSGMIFYPTLESL